MQVTYVDDYARYRIDCPLGVEVKRDDEGNDYLIVPDPDDPQQPYWFFGEVLVAAVQDGAFGLRLVSVDPIN